MTYTCNEPLINFHFWSGAKDRVKILTYKQLCDLDEILPDAMGWNDTDSIPSDTNINDLFWFEDDFIAELLGFDDWEALERYNSGEDNEYEIEEHEFETEEE